jgi:SAM-dependent methyltransferase
MASIEALRQTLTELDRANNDAWYRGLEDRKKAEASFHDTMRDRTRLKDPANDTYEEFFSNHRFYRTAQLSREYFEGWIDRHARDRVVLDFACGDGKTSVRAAQQGAALVIGIDISATSVGNARSNAARAGVSRNTFFLRADCEDTRLPAGCADVIICAGVLHHLDLDFVYPELARLLAPGGKVIAFEALDYNPLIKLYRMRTPHLRTEWEKAHILSLKDVRRARRHFEIGDIRYFHLTSMLGLWAPRLMPLFNGIDRALTRVAGVQLLAWMFTFELLSRDQGQRQA